MIVSAGLFIEDGKILIAKRAQNQNLAGYWEFPGGKLEDGETIFQCLEREIREELNVSCKAEKVFYEFDYIYPNGSIHLVGIKASLITQDFTLSVHDESRWVKIDKLLKLNLAPADILLAEELLKIF